MHKLHHMAPGTGDYPTLLVIDDAYINRTLLAEGLKSEYRVLTAESGEIGLKIAEAELPDAILLDVMMPDMDGFAVAKILTANPALSHIPVFFLTALSDQASQVSCLELGAVDFLTKPFSLNILRRRIANVIERDRLRANAVRSQAELNDSLAKQTAMRNSLEAIFNASSDALIVTHQDFKISRVNGNAETLLDQTHNQLVGASLRHFLLKDLKGSTLAIEDILSSATARECQLCNHETEHKFVSIQGQVFETSDNTTGYLFSLQDISQRIALDAKRRQAEKQRNDALFELGIQKNAMDEHALVSITDVKGNITYVNEKFCLTSGFDASELLGKSHRLIKSELHSKEFYAHMWGVIASGKTWHGEITNRSKDGTHYTVASTIVPWLNEKGVPYQYVAIRTDVTAQKNAEKELALARQRELSVGASIQQSLLFGKPPVDIRGLAVACFTEASQGVDGDFYTFNELSSYCFELLVGDVMGKGVTAALIGAGIKNTYYKTISTLMNQREDKSPPSPAEILNAMHLVITPELMRINSFVTLSLVRVDRRESKVTWVNAGHTPTLLSRCDGQEIIELLGDNLPLGIMEDEVYQQHIDAIDSGDALLIYSDGITEATNPEKIEYGPDRVKNILQLGSKNKSYPPVTITALRSDLGNFTHHAKNADDSTAILIQINPVRAGQRGSVQDRRAPDYLELPRQLDQLSQLRHRMAQFLKDQPEDFTDQMQLACFEAATNVIRHGAENLKKAPMTIAFSRNAEAVTVEIIYEGSPFVPKEAPSPDFSGYSEGGFGLFIIESSVSKVIYDSPLPGMARIQLVKNLEN